MSEQEENHAKNMVALRDKRIADLEAERKTFMADLYKARQTIEAKNEEIMNLLSENVALKNTLADREVVIKDLQQDIRHLELLNALQK